MDQIEIYPLKNGRWNWRKQVDGKTTSEGQKYDVRRDAIDGARRVNGSDGLKVVDAHGKVVGEVQKQGELRVVLLRPDGSEYGEIDPAPSTVGLGNAQRVTLVPASESAEATEVGRG